MMNAKKILCAILAGVLSVGVFSACGGNGGGTSVEVPDEILDVDYSKRADTAEYTPDGEVAYTGKQTVSKLATDKNGTKYLEVDGKPFLYLGAQLRTDFFLQLDEYALDDLDYLFKTAAKLNITCIQVPVCWTDVESEYGVYSSEYVNKLLELCNKYSLKLEILWFGSYMCTYTVADDGDSADKRHGYVPNYVYKDKETYPAIGVTDGGEFDFVGWLGRQYLLMPNTSALLARECAAISYMMQAVYDYDSTHGGRHTLIGVQVENEADGIMNWRFAEFNLQKTYNAAKGFLPASVTQDNMAQYCYEQMLEHVNTVAKAVKDSDYGCITRHNNTTQANWEERLEDFASLEYVDFVGLDPYDSNTSNMRNYVKKMNSFKDNFAHIAENGGEFFNQDLLELTAFSCGAGYSVFEVVCTSNEALKDWELRGVFKDLGNCRFAEKEQAPYLIAVNRALKDGHAAISCHSGMNVLNGETSDGAKNNTSSGTIKGFSYACTTSDRGVGYVAAADDYIYFSSTKADEFEFTAETYDKTNVEVGYFDSMNVWHTEQTISCSSGKLTLAPTRCYRIKKVN